MRFGTLELEAPDNTYPICAEMALVAEEAESRLPLGGSLLDLGCGAGTVALWIAQRNPDAFVAAVDVSEDAVQATKENAIRNGVMLDVYQSDVYDSVVGKFDVITCTLPWEAAAAYVNQPEPREAFINEDAGLARALVGAKNHLQIGGRFVMWGPYNVGREVFPMVGLEVERYIFDREENCVVIGG